MNQAERKRIRRFVLLYALIGAIFLLVTAGYLLADRINEQSYWEEGLAAGPEPSGEGVPVSCGLYVDSIRQLDMKGGCFRAVFQLWFRWEGSPALDMKEHFEVEDAAVRSVTVRENTLVDGVSYQRVEIDADIRKDFHLVRFPLESHQLRIRIRSLYPAEEAVLVNEQEGPICSEDIPTGFAPVRSGCAVNEIREDTSLYGSPTEAPACSLLTGAVEITRSDPGLLLKCFIALIGAVAWTFLVLYLCFHRSVDDLPLRSIPAALLSAATNIMVGANLLPDSLQTGFLEFANVGGIAVILAIALAAVHLKRMAAEPGRTEHPELYVPTLGRALFITLLALTAAAALLYPLACYVWPHSF